uniref:CCHC-type domain-containing protein n=1 Tax=Tanacetum cinerariifolium TaxID=118510 RepID=A0A6L2J3V9_TANCI|nr:hypothetical protein [Tanacetum cinerariifolium]
MAIDIWQSLLITHQGNSQVKDSKIDLLVQKYEQFTILEEESIDSGFARFNNIITSLKDLDEDFSSKNYVRKGKKERVKSITLKAKKESSDDETSTSGSEDEEYAMAVRNFKKFFRRKGKFVRQPREEKKSFRQRDEKKGKSDRKCFRCGDPNHLIGDCPKPSHNKDQNTFIGGLDDSKASTSRTKNMSFIGSSAEKATDRSTIKVHGSTLLGSVCLRTCLEPNKWIKDSGCSKHMTGNKSLFSTYKAHDEGIVVFGSNLKGKIIGKEDKIFFTQSKYIKEMLKKFRLEDSKPNKTSMPTEIKLTKDDEANSVDSSKYQENPKTIHLESVKRIFKYIRGTSHLGLWYPKGTRIETIVYADSDHAGDYVDRKSTTGIRTFK